MSMIERVETALKTFMHRLFGTRLQGPYIPIQIGKELSLVMQRQRKVSVSRIYVPNRYDVRLHSADFVHIEPIKQTLAEEMCQHLAGIAQREGLHFLSLPQVSFIQEEQLKPGHIHIETFFDDVESGSTRRIPELDDTLTDEGEVDEVTRIYEGESRPFLVCLSGAKEDVRYGLPNQGRFTIGRELDNDLVLDDPCVSRKHALITVHGDQVTLKDLGSRNGTYLNDVRIEEGDLTHGSRIVIGNTLLRFSAGE
ncbi:MAG: DUF3662 and FHA domain-containing protein [Limnochordia bacterium]|jgi:hypothetical protein|nr:DUF3662 and FHA domain-containing protein [Limnochordia bacterium]MDD4517298.1 DUF3662 and FHA domain-containing protein [Limnochordia bacterium]